MEIGPNQIGEAITGAIRNDGCHNKRWRRSRRKSLVKVDSPIVGG